MMKFDNKSITNFLQMFHLACYGMQFSVLYETIKTTA